MLAKSVERDPTVGVLAGGGIDSTLCMYQLRDQGLRARAIHVDYGQPASAHEWQAVQKIARRLAFSAEQLTLSGPFQFSIGEIQGRNAALIFMALMHLRPTERLLCIGIHAGTPFVDCSESFFTGIATAVAEQTDSRVRLVAPLLLLTKPEVVELARRHAVQLYETYSCQRGVEGGCGDCHSCKDRKALGC